MMYLWMTLWSLAAFGAMRRRKTRQDSPLQSLAKRLHHAVSSAKSTTFRLAKTSSEPAPPGGARLNTDVLALVMAELAHDDLRRTMATCHALYDLGLPLLLRTVDLTDAREAHAFHRHLLRDPTRCTRVRTLECTYSQISSRVPRRFRARRLAFDGMLPHTTALERLTVHFDVDADDAPHPDPAVLAWLAAQHALRAVALLDISFYDPDALRAFMRHLPPHRLAALHLTRRTSVHAPCAPFALLDELCAFSATLRDLRVRWPGAVLSGVPDGPVFSSVRRLQWDTIDEYHSHEGYDDAESILDVATLMQTFPNLEDLDVGSATPSQVCFGASSGSVLARCEARRARNVLAQRDMERSRGRSGYVTPWTRLRTLRGDALALWTLGVRCPVERLEVSVGGEYATGGHVVQVVRDAGAARTCIVVGGRAEAAGAVVVGAEDVVHALRVAGVQNVRVVRGSDIPPRASTSVSRPAIHPLPYPINVLATYAHLVSDAVAAVLALLLVAVLGVVAPVRVSVSCGLTTTAAAAASAVARKAARGKRAEA